MHWEVDCRVKFFQKKYIFFLSTLIALCSALWLCLFLLLLFLLLPLSPLLSSKYFILFIFVRCWELNLGPFTGKTHPSPIFIVLNKVYFLNALFLYLLCLSLLGPNHPACTMFCSAILLSSVSSSWDEIMKAGGATQLAWGGILLWGLDWEWVSFGMPPPPFL